MKNPQSPQLPLIIYCTQYLPSTGPCSSCYSIIPQKFTSSLEHTIANFFGLQMSVLSALLSLLPEETVAKTSDSGTGTGGSSGTNSTTTPTGSSPNPSDTAGSSGTHTGVSVAVLLGSLLLTSFLFN